MIKAKMTYNSLYPVTGMTKPSKKGPKPRPASRAMKNVDVARPSRCGGVNLTAMAWVLDCILPKPSPIRPPAISNVAPVPTKLSKYIPAAKMMKAGYITKFAPLLSIKRPVKGRDNRTTTAYTTKKKLAVSTKSISMA